MDDKKRSGAGEAMQDIELQIAKMG